MELDERLVDAAIDQMRRRWPVSEHAVAAAVYLDDGRILTSVALDNLNASATLCAETGAICQAYTLGRRVTSSVCVAGSPGSDGVAVLAPCGICQERLALWGPEVQVGVVDPTSSRGWAARKLVELNPFYWGEAYADGGGWPSAAVHAS
ncbi:cytidine deaminase [Saccharopolyspora erythraea]|uniref:cytidine deaminase n=1 Tax=Saccharopolyspora erythraea TaxID=1836 RepID=UPI001BA675EF|nr:cytidine deaminase [Saccharopolyspora erythraea]QUH02643.1 cytidine deaminase [Saccharopolyspora erythraea]